MSAASMNTEKNDYGKLRICDQCPEKTKRDCLIFLLLVGNDSGLSLFFVFERS